MSYGLIWLDFGVSWERITLVLAVQYICRRCWKLPRYDPRSALISALSLCLLLRTGHPALAVLAAVVTISSKFLIRVDNRHVFNPTNFCLAVMMLLTDQVWVSRGQWGSVAFFGFLLACLGVVVVNRAARSDVTYAFLGCYLAIVIGRTLWLGDPVSIAVHQLQNGGLVLSAFFMILRPQDDTGFERGTSAVRPADCHRGGIRAVRPVSTQRSALVTGRRCHDRPVIQSMAPRPPLHVGRAT